MTTRDLYTLAVRLAGLVCWIFSAFALVHVIAIRYGMSLPSQYSLARDALVGLIWFLLGRLLTCCAEPLTHVVYGSRKAG